MILNRMILALMCLLAGGVAHAQEQAPSHAVLSKTDHLTLATLRTAGKTQTTVLVVSVPGHSAELEQALRESGCAVAEAAPEIGYIRCVAPIARLERICQLPGIESLTLSTYQLSGIYALAAHSAPAPNDKPRGAGDIATPNRYMSDDNPFTATRAMQALQFKALNPTFDGRGVAVGEIEDQVDLLTPEIKWAKDIHGQAAPKILDWTVTGSWDPPSAALPDWMFASGLTGLGNVRRPPFVVPTETVEAIRPGVFRFHNEDYFVPVEAVVADWRMGIFESTELKPPLSPVDVNLDGITDAADNYTILFDTRGKRVWLDLNHNHDFRDETPLRDFSVAREFGVFGHDNPATELRESRTFVVHLRPERTEVWLEISLGSHGDMVASVLGGSGFLGSVADGIAPGAQIVLHEIADGFTHTYIENLLQAFRERSTDVITYSGGDDIRPTDGSGIIDALTSRMIDTYHKPIFAAAGNSGPALGELSSPGVAATAFSIGAYTPREAWQANFGVTPTAAETPAPYSATGPTDNGGLKPDFLGVTGTLATTPGYDKGYAGQTHYYALPPGYMISSGTSAATPTAAGAGALLISAAKQRGIPYDVARLRAALVSTARFLPGVEARIQGNGLIQIADAWDALQKLKSPSWRPALISSAAPVKTTTSHRLSVTDRGPGIYEREGWAPGMSGTREIAFTRSDGAPTAVTYRLEWKGDRDVFTSTAELSLPLNQTARLPVRIHPKGSGSFSAILNLIDRGTGLVAYQTLNTVIVPHLLNAANGYRAEVSGKAPRPGNADVFVAVPPGTQTLQVVARLKGCNGALEWTDPDGNDPGRIAGAIPHTENTFEPVKHGEIRRAIDDPKPGVWQLSVANGGDAVSYDDKAPTPLQACDFTLTAAALGSRIETTTTSVQPGRQYAVGFSSQMAAFSGRIESLGLGSANAAQPTLSSEYQPAIYDLNVPQGASRIEASIAGASDPAAQIDLYLFDATGEVPFLAAFSARDGSDKQVGVLNPKAGRWKVVVDPYRLPHGSVQIDYRDSFYHDAFGKIVVQADKAKALSAEFTANVYARPESPRTLVGAIDVVSNDVYVTIVDPDAKVPEPKPDEFPKPVPTKTVLIPIQTQVFPIDILR